MCGVQRIPRPKDYNYIKKTEKLGRMVVVSCFFLQQEGKQRDEYKKKNEGRKARDTHF